jgi:hypothetical protein
MFLFNNTIGIDRVVEQRWLSWLKETHIPTVMNTGLFIEFKMYKVLHENEDDTISYSIQFFSTTIDNVQQYLENFAPTHAAELQKEFKNRHVAFRTLLQEI